MSKAFSTVRWGRSLLPLCLVLLTACSGSGELGRERSGDLTFILSSDPSPLKVGQGADMELELVNAQGERRKGCQVTLARTMPGMEMAEDKMQHHLTERGPGTYQVRLAEFHMGGDWRFAVQAVCQGQRHSVVFEQNIPWPK